MNWKPVLMPRQQNLEVADEGLLACNTFWRIASQGEKHENRGLGMPVGQRLLKANAIATLTMVTQLAITSTLGDIQIGSKKEPWNGIGESRPMW
jgi:hypothetical protein